MSRYIDADRAIESLFDYCNGKKTIGQCIDDTPTEDVKPIVYGEWIYLYDFDGLEICECNKCGVSQEFDGGIFDVNSRRTNYCPNCGADMRKESEDKNDHGTDKTSSKRNCYDV